MQGKEMNENGFKSMELLNWGADGEEQMIGIAAGWINLKEGHLRVFSGIVLSPSEQ